MYCSGWVQAFVLWNFVLSSALLLQKFVVALGLGGLLPGEPNALVTKEDVGLQMSLLLQNIMVALGLGGLLPREHCAGSKA